jgi:orotate phosphoribosyltransferase
MANRFKNKKINKVVGFTVGGNILAEQVANYLNAKPILGERKRNALVFPPSVKIEKGDGVLIVEDVLTTAEDIIPIIHAIQKTTKGFLVGVGVVVDRRIKESNLGIKMTSLLDLKNKLNLWPPDERCPLCKKKIPVTDFSSPDSDPFSILYSLPDAERNAMGRSYFNYYKKIKKKELKDGMRGVLEPIHELPGKKYERVAILGSFDQHHYIEQIAKIVSALDYFAITSMYIFNRGDGKFKRWEAYKYESMNDFLCRMIFSCQYIIIIYQQEGGQFIETSWCNQGNKPTLGIAYLRPWTIEKQSCKYLINGNNFVYCNGFEAFRSEQQRVGGHICLLAENKSCPFPSSQLTKMIIDIYGTNPTMHLFGVGMNSQKNIPQIIRNFLSSHGNINPKRALRRR